MAIHRKDIKRLVREALVAGVRRNGERVFATSQTLVPVDKGTLKKSGYFKNISSGITIGYTAPYSSRVHSGSPAIPYTGTQVVQRKAYTRKDGAYVKATDVKYINKRLVGFRPKLEGGQRGPLIFRVLKEEKARKGTFFLSNALKQEIVHLPEDLKVYLKRLESIV